MTRKTFMFTYSLSTTLEHSSQSIISQYSLNFSTVILLDGISSVLRTPSNAALALRARVIGALGDVGHLGLEPGPPAR